ncbi:MAG: FAD-binding oxidoreductase [Bacillota bacterium]
MRRPQASLVLPLARQNFQQVSGPEDISSGYLQYLTDESRFGEGSADRIVFPDREEHVVQVLFDANSTGEPVTVSGGRTGIVGGAIPMGGTLMSLERMNRILGVRQDGSDWFLRLEPGVSVRGLDTALTGGLEGLGEPFDARRYFYPIDPTEDTAHIGGTVATNASGSRSLFYGVTREYVESIRVVLPTGHTLAISRGEFRAARGGAFVLERAGHEVQVPVPAYRRPAVKNVAGFYTASEIDLLDIFIGSEGTLGVITEVEIRLVPRPPMLFTGLAFFSSREQAVSFVRLARGDGDKNVPVYPLSLEYLDSLSLRLLERHAQEVPRAGYPPFPPGSEAAILFEEACDDTVLEAVYEAWEQVIAAAGSSMDDTWGGVDQASASPIKRLRHTLPEAVNATVARNRQACPTVYKVGTDMAVEDALLDEFVFTHDAILGPSGLDYVVFGHIGQNHLHANLFPKTPEELRVSQELVRELAGRVVAMGGSPLVEHGGGRLKHTYVRMIYGEEGLAEMAALKRALDPRNVLNRGVLLDPEVLN